MENGLNGGRRCRGTRQEDGDHLPKDELVVETEMGSWTTDHGASLEAEMN